MAYTLRNFKKDDARNVRELIVSILTKEYPYDRKAYADTDLDRIGEIYGGERECFFVIEEDGKIVGSAGVKWETKDDALLRRLFVHPSHRKMGYGSQLLKTAVKFCKDNNYKKIFFRCTDRMIDAMRLCEKEGFKKEEALEISGLRIHQMELKV
jgi:putative acetyltransferase